MRAVPHSQTLEVSAFVRRKARAEMNRISIDRQGLILDLLTEGMGLRGIARVTGHHRKTVVDLMQSTAEHCQTMTDNLFRDLKIKRIQVDELWTYVGCKRDRLSQAQRDGERGDQFLFFALDADSKLIPAFTVGKRTGETAIRFMADLRRRVYGTVQISTDAFNGYLVAVDRAFGAEVDYAQVIKTFRRNGQGKHESYSPRALAHQYTSIIQGNPDRRYISTSLIERANLTVRQSLRRFVRLTLGFSKKLECLESAVAVWMWAYNFRRGHQALNGATPAMSAGVARFFLGWGEVLR